MKAQNNFQKYRYYISKRIEVFFHSLQKSQIEGRKKGPKAVLNSLPKSGTHLLESLFTELPLMRHTGKRTLRIQTQNPIQSKLRTLSSIKKGQFLLAHMQYHPTIVDTANDNNIKIIHLIRDPRDVMLSHLNYIENMDLTQKSHKFISQFRTRPEKLNAMLVGKDNVLEPFAKVLHKFEPWINHKDVLCIKFEDLIGEKGGGSKSKQQKVVKEICNFIGLKIDDESIETISNLIYSPKSSTFNKGKIDNWRHSLNEEEKQLINDALKGQIQSYQYND